MQSTIKILLFIIALIPMQANAANFQTWLTNFKNEAAQEGISQSTIQSALGNIQPVMRAIELDKKQPEKKITFAQYKKNVVNQQRINEGRRLMALHKNDLLWVEKTFGVQPQYIVSLWGIETNFGSNTGGFKVVDSLATLAWEGRRAEFFKSELIKALKIIDEGHISYADMKGSWAGAMGQCQFMPSSFFNFAVDANGDGHKDIWNTKIDVFASAANYLTKSGWKHGERWGRRVVLPQNFPENLIDRNLTKPLSYWASQGVKLPGGTALPSDNISAAIVAPDGPSGEAYIVYNNFQTIMKWNRSTYFATSVGLLADAIAQ